RRQTIDGKAHARQHHLALVGCRMLPRDGDALHAMWRRNGGGDTAWWNGEGMGRTSVGIEEAAIGDDANGETARHRVQEARGRRRRKYVESAAEQWRNTLRRGGDGHELDVESFLGEQTFG